MLDSPMQSARVAQRQKDSLRGKMKQAKQDKKLKKMRKNIRLYYGYRVLCTMNFVMPIFMLFLVDKGLSAFQIFITQAFYTFTELVLTVPSGAFADKVGRKKTLIISTVLYAAAFLTYSFADSFSIVMLGEFIFAISSATFHGTGEAFLYDTLAESGQRKRYKKVLGTAMAIQSVVMGLAGICGGLMAKYDLALPFLASAMPVAISMLPLFFLDEPRRTMKEDLSCAQLMRQSAVLVGKHKRMRNLLYFMTVTSLTGFVAWTLYQPLLTDMGLRIEYLGFVLMLMSMAHAIGNKLSHMFEEKFGHLDLLFVFAGFHAVLLLLIYLAGGYYLLIWALLLDLMGGIGSPILSEWMNRYSSSDNRATVLSLSMMASNLSFSLFAPLFGLYVDAYSAQAAYLLLALVSGAYALRQLAILVYGKMSTRAA